VGNYFGFLPQPYGKHKFIAWEDFRDLILNSVIHTADTRL